MMHGSTKLKCGILNFNVLLTVHRDIYVQYEPTGCAMYFQFMSIITLYIILRCVIDVVCRKTNGEANIGHENTTMVVWICGGV